jgi:hypothetical protein
LSLIIYAVGWLLFGLASLKARVYPRGPVVTVIIGAALDLLGNFIPFAGLVIYPAVVWLGFSLFSGRAAPVEQTPRVAYENLAATACNLCGLAL